MSATQLSDDPCNTSMVDRNTEIVHAASAIVGDGHVLVEPDERAGYETDWTGRYRGSCVARRAAGTTAEVSETAAGVHAVSASPW